MRGGEQDLCRKVTLWEEEEDSWLKIPGKYRIGRPRTSWLITTAETAWMRMRTQGREGCNAAYDPFSEEQMKIIIDGARENMF